MTPVRFSECLRSIRWTAIDIVNALQCDLAWIEALEIGEVPVPEDLARWLETIACFHASNPPPLDYRAMADFFWGARRRYGGRHLAAAMADPR